MRMATASRPSAMPSAKGKKPGPGRPTLPNGNSTACQAKNTATAMSVRATIASPTFAETGRAQAPCSSASERMCWSDTTHQLSV